MSLGWSQSTGPQTRDKWLQTPVSRHTADRLPDCNSYPSSHAYKAVSLSLNPLAKTEACVTSSGLPQITSEHWMSSPNHVPFHKHSFESEPAVCTNPKRHLYLKVMQNNSNVKVGLSPFQQPEIRTDHH